MNPYEATAEEIKRQSQEPKRLVKTAGKIGGAALALAGSASFAPVLARAAPLLSQYVPEALAIKGLSKINPKFGEFINSAMEGGYDFNEIKNFLGQQIEKSQEPEFKMSKSEGNIIRQVDDKLDEFIKKNIDKGMTPAQAVSLIEIYPHHKQSIKKIEEFHKMPFLSIVEQLYGGAKKDQQQQAQQPQANPEMLQDPNSMPQGQASAEMQAQTMQQPQNQSQQPGPGQQAFMQILQKINQKLGAK